MHDSRNPPEPTLIPSRGFLTPPGGQLVQTLVGHSQSAVYGLAASSDGKYAVTGYADFFQYILFLGKYLTTCKRTQRCWPTTPNIVGCYMLCPFAHPVAYFCVLLGRCFGKFENCETFSPLQTEATLLAKDSQQCWELLRLFARRLKAEIVKKPRV